MADFVFNISKGEVKKYCKLDGGANDALIMVPVETTGIETEATLKDHDTLSAVLAGTSNEQTTLGCKTITSATITVDDTNERVDIDVADQTYTVGNGNAISRVLFCYDPDTTGGDDTTVVPLTGHDLVTDPDGTDLVVQIAAAGFFRAA